MAQVPPDANRWRDALRDLGVAIRLRLREIAGMASEELAEPVAHEGGDTIYRIDRCVEPVIERVVQGWPEQWKPLILVVEGMGTDGLCWFGPENQSAKYRVIVDPIDGTRGLMYDKRSAWFLAAVFRWSSLTPCPAVGRWLA
jgi:fructose-1,6-bisphosphatase/inositol monophosphatase family enzyme